MAFGYFLWQLDGIFCSELTALKRSIGMPWGFLLEMHGWWHLFTAIGAYVFMVMVDSLTRDELELPGRRFAWLDGPTQTVEKM
jgi:dihydroceramidase